MTAIKAKKDQVRKLQTEIAEISSKVTEKPSGGGIGGGSMSSFYLQKLLNVTQDRSGKKSSPENRSPKSSVKDASSQSKSFMQQKTLNVFGKSKGFNISPTKAYIDAESEGSGYSIQIQGQIKSEPRPVVKHNTQAQDAYGVSQLSLLKHKSQINRDSQTRLAMIGLNKSYTMGMSPCSEGGKSSKCASNNGYGDYSFVEGSSKNIEIVENESDLGVIDKFSKWIQRIRPKY